jgi:UDP-N-acetylglucosamine 2-epimerase
MTYHPTTLGGVPEAEIGELIAAMGSVAATYVITLPNNDDGADPIRAALVDFAHHDRARRVAVDQLGAAAFAAMMRNSDAMLGNSSSALIEAPLFALPAVNVGDRQRGRRREANVIDVACERDAIIAGLRRALLPATRKMLTVPSADGRTGERIAAILADWACPAPPRKSFVDR